MKVIGISGSPRIGGNSEILLDQVLKGAKDNGADISKYILDNMDIAPCHACEECAKGIDCKNNDECNELLDEVLACDAIVFASPIYYGQMSAQGKLFTDRFFSISKNENKSFEGTKAILVFAHGAPTGAYEQYIELTKASPFSYTGFDVKDVIVAGDIHDVGEVKNNSEIMDKAYESGKNL